MSETNQNERMVMPCPFCGNENIRIYFVDGDSWIKDIVCTCDKCSATITANINRRLYLNFDSKSCLVDEERFEADVQRIGTEAWNKRA